MPGNRKHSKLKLRSKRVRCNNCPACYKAQRKTKGGQCPCLVLPLTVKCFICGLDGRGNITCPGTLLLECLCSLNISHPDCWAGPGRGQQLDSVANTWECPDCSQDSEEFKVCSSQVSDDVCSSEASSPLSDTAWGSDPLPESREFDFCSSQVIKISKLSALYK